MSNGPDERAAAPARLTAAQANDAWMKLIGRYDFYNGSVNTKAALLVAFNTFVGGGIVLKWKDIHDAFGTEKVAFILQAYSCWWRSPPVSVSLWFTFRSVNPFLRTPVIPNDYHSLLFFGDVRKFSAENYHEQLGEAYPCVQALLPETGVLEEPGGIQDSRSGFVAGVQPSVRPPL